LRELQAIGVRVPMLEAEPALSMRAQVALIAWRDLCGERQLGMSLGPIPWRAVVAWGDRYRVGDVETLIELVQALDVEFLNRETSPAQPDADREHAQSAQRYGAAPVPIK
jgi:hypothetical protein